jgi:hypothetical protein
LTVLGFTVFLYQLYFIGFHPQAQIHLPY